MNAETAYKQSIKAQNEINARKSEVRQALKKIKEATERGELECNYWNDNEVRKALKLMGYTVSEMWEQHRPYQDEYMTISWAKRPQDCSSVPSNSKS